MYYIFTKRKVVAGLLVSAVLAFGACRKEFDPATKYAGQPELPVKYKQVALISFKDKKTSDYSISQPQAYLSERAINRRKKQHIAIEESDIPVSKQYTAEVLKKLDAKLLLSSKWMNEIVIHLPEGADLEKLAGLSFVKAIKRLGEYQQGKTGLVIPPEKPKPSNPKIIDADALKKLEVNAGNYGSMFPVINMHNAQALYQAGYYGEGKMIAMLSDGFGYLNEEKDLPHLFSGAKIKASYDFINRSADLSKTSSKSNDQLGILAAINPGTYIGLAPLADFVLLKVDESSTQEPMYEYSWIAGVEFADSVGVDIINSANQFGLFYDDPAYNMKAEMADGKTAKCSQVADMAFNKGILLIQMLNPGSTAGNFVIPPADSKHALVVGNLSSTSGRTSWSILDKPTADGRIKPDLATLSQDIPVNSIYGAAYDFAYSPAIISGLTACLWQALPQKTAAEMRQILLKSADGFTKPDTKKGYGIPNFAKALKDNQ